MTAAYRLKGGGWLLATVAIALGFYLVSLRVAEERKRLEGVDARIAAAQRDIRALETEFDTRANLVQLERWNGDTLALAAPTAGQFVHDEGQLAAIDVAAAAAATPVPMAALVVPSIVPPAPVAALAVAQPALASHLVEARASAPIQLAAATLDPAARGSAKAAAAPPSLPARALARLADVARDAQAVAKVRPQAVALLDNKLLSDATLGDLIAKAKREASRR